jgi:TolB-like protein
MLAARDDQLSLDSSNIDVDVLAIRALAARGDWTGAAARFGGTLVAGLDVGDDAFEDWLSAHRRDLTNEMAHVLEKAAGAATGQARIALAQRLVDIDPLRETSYRLLIAAAMAAGDPALARRCYDDCALLLQRELGIEPAAETTALLRPDQPTVPGVDPRLPSIAVLPFANLSDSADQRYFSDGVSADIATELQRFRDAVVRTVQRGASDETSVDAVARGKSMGVSFVVTGSVRRMGSRVRLTVQLVDTEDGAQLWSEKFDAAESEIFDIQDRIVQSITAQLAKRLRVATIARSKRKPPQSLAAYELVLRAEALQLGEIASEAEATRLYEDATALDSTYGRAHAGAGFFIVYTWLRDYTAPNTVLDLALDRTRKAVALDDNDAFCHLMHGQVLMWRRQHDLAAHHFQRALSLNPNDPVIHANNGIYRGFAGDPVTALTHFDQALVLDPHFNESWYWRDRGVVHFIARQYEQAINALERSPTPQDWSEAYIAASYAYLGDMAEAERHRQMSLAICPIMTTSAIASREPYRQPEDRDHLTHGMRLAGFR